jgi:hypothetical protein
MNRPTQKAPIRMLTVVIGLIALAVSLSVLLDSVFSVDIPDRTLALGVLIGAGLLLLGNGIATAAREQRARAEDADPHLGT